MNIESLQLFVEVMHKRSFIEVAQSHGMAASSVSRSVSSLESELGIRLFQRTTRKVTPTEAGIKYFERISVVLKDIEAAEYVAKELTNKLTGTLRITAPSVFGDMYIVPLLPLLAKHYPDLSIELLLNDAFVDLIEERIDVAIRLGSLEDSSYIARKLSNMQFYVCVSQSYIDENTRPLDPQDLHLHNCLLHSRTRHLFNWSFKQKNNLKIDIPIQGKYLLTNSNAVKKCTLAGMGVSMLPDWLIEKELKNGQLINLFDDYEVTPKDYDGSIWLVYPNKEYLPLKVCVFNDFLFEQLSKK